MTRVTIQMGHVPRTTGSTGTWREQEFARALAPRIAALLEDHGHDATVIGADDSAPGGDVFVALHLDTGNATVAGPGQSSSNGASVGYPDDNGRQLAEAWKAAHTRHGYPGLFLPDNYTAALAGFYMWSRTTSYRWRFLAEHGTATHAGDEAWLFSHLDDIAAAHVEAIDAITGTPPTEDDVTDQDILKIAAACATAIRPTVAEEVAKALGEDPALELLVSLLRDKDDIRFARLKHIVRTAPDQDALARKVVSLMPDDKNLTTTQLEAAVTNAIKALDKALDED